MASRPVPRPTVAPNDVAPARYSIEFQDGAAQKSWQILVGQRKAAMTECWDHLAADALVDLPRKCKPLVGQFAKRGLRQYTVGPKQRVWYAVAGRTVTIRDIHRTHPKGTD